MDGLRGLLAMVVLRWHLTERMGLLWLGVASQAAVCSFFVLSGYVLPRSWDGKFGLFLASRFLRLWPVYALSLAAGYAIAEAIVLVAIPLVSNSKPRRKASDRQANLVFVH